MRSVKRFLESLRGFRNRAKKCGSNDGEESCVQPAPEFRTFSPMISKRTRIFPPQALSMRRCFLPSVQSVEDSRSHGKETEFYKGDGINSSSDSVCRQWMNVPLVSCGRGPAIFSLFGIGILSSDSSTCLQALASRSWETGCFSCCSAIFLGVQGERQRLPHACSVPGLAAKTPSLGAGQLIVFDAKWMSDCLRSKKISYRIQFFYYMQPSGG